ncbi:D-alanyl-D-alanine carboxypeptidase family protein [Dactylosporangium sp. NPDC000521]|uniref:M15 family metallopeptidase n=1 Tax=Dactylosporangium sp. NPDC000521 TaxID=3363975 RepID=UPI0036B62D3F
MRVEGITGIATRMAEIRSQLAALSPPPPAVQAAPESSFASALSAATSLQDRYENGRIPVTALAEVGSTGHRLAAPAAAALESLMRAAQRDGVKIGITDSYRSYDEQVDLARRKGLYSQGGLAAKPGTSDHGWGLAVDLDLDARAQAWMRANGGRFGFTENTPREPWHWKFTA